MVDDDGAESEKVARRDVWTLSHVQASTSGERTVRVTAYWYDDEEPAVELAIGGETARMTVSMSPGRARMLSDDLLRAAARADRGDAELGEPHE